MSVGAGASLFNFTALVVSTYLLAFSNDVCVLQKLDSTTFAFNLVQSTAGDDIRFVSDDDRTVLAYEIETYNPSAGVLAFWVLLPLLPNGQTTTFFMYFSAANVTAGQTPYEVRDVIGPL